MDELVQTIIEIAVPWVLAFGLAIVSYYLKYKVLPKTAEELQTVIDDTVEQKDKVESTLKEVISFFDQEKPMSDTTIETIKEVIPASTYQMSEESQARILSYCADETEKQRVLTEIYNWENPQVTGEECCDYIITTSGGTFRVQYGVPELITESDYVYLSQTQINEICSLFNRDDREKSDFSVIWEIMDNERKGVTEYIIQDSKVIVTVNNGSYSVRLS